MNRQVLVTGAAGFIGSHCCRALLEAGFGVVGAVRWAMREEPAYAVFNLGESRTVRLDVLIRMIAAALGVEPQVEALPPQPGDVRRTCADISNARAVLGYEPRVPIEQGIPQFVRWYRETYG